MRGLALAERGRLALALSARWIETASTLEAPNRAHAEETREARLERRRRRREAARRLKDFTEAGPQYFWASGADDDSDEASPVEEEAMWRHLLRHSRSAGAKDRVRRAWRQWEEEQEAGGGASSEGHASGGSWWQGDHETSWEFHSRATAEEAARRQREAAGSAHPRFRERQEWRWWEQQWDAAPQGPRFGREVVTSLAALGLPAAPPALPTLAELKAAFRRSAMQHHPDRHAADPAAAVVAEKRFKEVQAAFQTLVAMVAPPQSL